MAWTMVPTCDSNEVSSIVTILPLWRIISGNPSVAARFAVTFDCCAQPSTLQNITTAPINIGLQRIGLPPARIVCPTCELAPSIQEPRRGLKDFASFTLG